MRILKKVKFRLSKRGEEKYGLMIPSPLFLRAEYTIIFDRPPHGYVDFRLYPLHNYHIGRLDRVISYHDEIYPYFSAHSDDRIVVIYRFFPNGFPDEELSYVKARKRNGNGTRVLERIITDAKTQKAKVLLMEYANNEPVRNFLQKHDFRELRILGPFSFYWKPL